MISLILEKALDRYLLHLVIKRLKKLEMSYVKDISKIIEQTFDAQKMRPHSLDQYIVHWCLENGWEKPHKIIEDTWYAIPPNWYMPQVVPMSKSLEAYFQQAAFTYGVSVIEAKLSFDHVFSEQARKVAYVEAKKANLGCYLKIATIRFGRRIGGWTTHIRVARYLKYLTDRAFQQNIDCHL
jgi:hypothetical protein